ncbi:MAG TPA: AI-2E family transporter [Terriglobales bacterium]|nr:AI-2E family transporter [Terriglobales bacterium]
MDLQDHLRTTGSALHRWFVAQTYDSLIVGGIWLVGLWIIGVPWAPFWALLAFAFQYVPHFGPILSLIGPAFAGVTSGGGMRLIYVLILYATIAVADGLVLQPYIMKRTVKVPIWASILTPLVLGFFFNFIGVLVSAPLLAVLYTYKARTRQPEVLPPDPRPQQLRR